MKIQHKLLLNEEPGEEPMYLTAGIRRNQISSEEIEPIPTTPLF